MLILALANGLNRGRAALARVLGYERRRLVGATRRDLFARHEDV